MTASGTFGFAKEFVRIRDFRMEDIGAVMLKGTTLEPREGNPPPRIAETPAGVLNSIGLQNPGVERVIGEILPTLARLGPKLIANVAGNTVEEYAEVARRFDACGLVHAVEVNISCPNVKKGGALFGNDPAASARVIRAVRRATRLPVMAKLSPNAAEIAPIAAACIESGADMLSLINTLQGMAIDVETRCPVLGNVCGGLSGPAVKPVALWKVHQVYQVARKQRVPIIGMGGIENARDAIEFFLAGASAVAVGSAMLWNYRVCTEIVAGLRRWMAKHGVMRVSELTGSLILPTRRRTR
jgi:dihydroorotate dehydrogenase (NAD+) catalytic subunit